MKSTLRKLIVAGLVVIPAVLVATRAQPEDPFGAALRSQPNHTREQSIALVRAYRDHSDPRWRDLSLLQRGQRFAAMIGRVLRGASSTTSPAPADFFGNLTAISAPSGQGVGLQRQADCSLTLFSGPFNLSAAPAGIVAIQSSTANYQTVLHDAAGLAGKANVFSGGCSASASGTSSGKGVFLGSVSQGRVMYAGHLYNATGNGDALFYGTADPVNHVVTSVNSDSTLADVLAVTAGDLNGDGLADIVGLDAGAGTIAVWLAHADGSVGTATTYALPGNAGEAAVMADFNGDGKLDVLVASHDASGQEYVSVFFGNGDGTLGTARSISISTPSSTAVGAQTRVTGLVAADLRGTGHPDVVGANGIVLLNNGSGVFSQAAGAFAPRVATSSSGPTLVAADFNGDGKPDVAVNDGHAIQIYLGKGDGTFATGRAYASIPDVGYLSAVDLDGDGNIDLYVGVAGGGYFTGDEFEVSESYALMGNGDGTFQGAQILPFTQTGNNVADLNGDGHLDAIGVNADASLTVYLGDSTGNFNAGSTITTSPVTIAGTAYTITGIDSIAIGDINGDGKPDLAYIATGFNGPGGTPGVFIALGNGQGGFAAPTFYSVLSPLTSGIDDAWTISNLRLADLNRDGKADLLYNYADTAYYTGANPPPSVTYFGNAVQLGNGDGTFQSPKTIPYRNAPYNQFAPSQTSYIQLVTDLNRDGIPDLVFLSQGTTVDGTLSTYVSTIQVALGKGDGTFTTPATVTGPAIVSQSFTDVIPASIAVADMNGDSIPDLVAVGTSAPDYNLQIAIALGKGDGTFGAPSITATAGQYLNNDQQLAIGDFNGDGKLDVAILDPFITSGAGIYPGNGDGTLQFTGTAGAAQPVLAIYLPVGGASFAADLNGDGKADIVSGTTLLLSQAAVAGQPDFAIGLSAGSATVAAGGPAQTTVTLTPSNGFSQDVALSCSGLPAGAACSFAPASVPVNGTAGTSKLTITTTAPSAAAAAAAAGGPATGGGSTVLLALGLPLLWVRRRHLTRGGRAGGALLLFCAALTASSCGGGGGGGGGSGSGGTKGGTPAGTYTVTIQATGGTSAHSASFALTVN